MTSALRPGAVQDGTEQGEARRDTAQPAVTSVTASRRFGTLVEERNDQRADKRDDHGKQNKAFGRETAVHRSPPSSALAAVLAMPAVHSVSMPK